MTNNNIRRSLPALLLALLASGLVGGNGVGQSFPARNIRIVIPNGPGTPPDIIPRVVANQVSEAEGWHFVIENKPGAIQTLAGSEVLRSPARWLFDLRAGDADQLGTDDARQHAVQPDHQFPAGGAAVGLL